MFRFSNGDYEPIIRPGSPSKLSDNVDEFCWKYFATLDRNENILYSPYGINSVLSILANGAYDDTCTELLTVLAAENVDLLNNEYRKLSEFFKIKYRGENIFMASTLFLIDETFAGRGLINYFRKVVNDNYDSYVRLANFSGDVDDEKSKIMEWISYKTKGLIPDYQSTVTDETLNDLLNVACFQGKWKRPFAGCDTREKIFRNKSGTTSVVKMMHKAFYRDCAIAYFADDKFKAIELPYSTNAVMYLILPLDENALDVAEFWNKQTTDYRTNFINALKNSSEYNGKVIVQLPKFKLDIEKSIVENFRAMGIVRSFSDDAELFGILKGTPTKIGVIRFIKSRSIKICDVKHRAKVTVDELGTGAAAVPEDQTIIRHAPPNNVAHFIADRPFLFLIRDMAPDIMLFAGAVNKL